jgi:hypothetical protein
MKAILSLSVVTMAVPTTRASPTRVVGRNFEKDTTTPGALVLQLPAELTPSLIMNGPIQAGFRLHVDPRLFQAAFGRPRHIAYLQALHYYQSVIFAQVVGGLVKLIQSNVGNASMKALNF